MHYDFIAIPDAEVPQAVEPIFQHVITTYASEATKTVSVWRAVPHELRDRRAVAGDARERCAQSAFTRGTEFAAHRIIVVQIERA